MPKKNVSSISRKEVDLLHRINDKIVKSNIKPFYKVYKSSILNFYKNKKLLDKDYNSFQDIYSKIAEDITGVYNNYVINSTAKKLNTTSKSLLGSELLIYNKEILDANKDFIKNISEEATNGFTDAINTRMSRVIKIGEKIHNRNINRLKTKIEKTKSQLKELPNDKELQLRLENNKNEFANIQVNKDKSTSDFFYKSMLFSAVQKSKFAVNQYVYQNATANRDLQANILSKKEVILPKKTSIDKLTFIALIGKQWICQFINSRDTHERAHGQVVKIDDNFTIGGEKCPYPRWDGLSGEEKYGCKCEIINTLVN